MQVSSDINGNLLTNVEVGEILDDIRKNRSTDPDHYIQLQNREFVEKKTLKHLSKSKTAGLTSEHLVQCVAQIKDLGLRLTEAETIQTANLLPSSDVELYLIIEDCSDRVTPEQQEKLFEIINNTIALTTAGAIAK